MALGVAIVGLMLVALAPPGVSAGQPQASLTISPGVYVGGQRLTFEGNIGERGIQPIRMQILSGRPGDGWTPPDAGFRTWTKSDGSFRFHYSAPSMRGMRVRMVSARAVTPAQPLHARSQDLVLRAVSGTPGLNPGQVLAGEPFVIKVDTTPTLARRHDLPGPAFEGRTLTLQQRIGDGHWDSLARTTADIDGQGSFDVTVDQSGQIVYRVREEDWMADGNEIGWFPSFPAYVDVLPAVPTTATSTAQQPRIQTASGGATKESVPARPIGRRGTASKRHHWGPSVWDFAWPYGESLTSRPYRGSDRHGKWLDSSDGSGRAVPHNGALLLDSQRQVGGPGDHGTTMLTLRGNARRHGRWETGIRLKSPENDVQDYRVKVELVPDRPGAYHCGAQNITIADVAAHDSTVTVGAKALRGAREWTRRKRIGSLMGPSVNFAVEVTKSHISWFVNGRVIATLRSAAAVSDVPMTLRLSMVGDGQNEMNRTQAIFDWQRGFSLERGRPVVSGHALRSGNHDGGC
ncbi:MAG TPA: hypothetical protein VMT27_03320 [Actinomycetes bacterium]|nr:hypothetical protein [Actinomycetes bacterium]